MGAKIYNTDAKKNLIDGAGIQVSTDKVPEELSEKALPVIDMTPDFHRVANIVRSASCLNSTATTIYSTPTDRDFYITGATLNTIKDATATSTISTIFITTAEGFSDRLLRIDSFTLTAQNLSTSLSLSFPIKLKRGSVVNITNGTSVGNISSAGTIVGYTVEDY